MDHSQEVVKIMEKLSRSARGKVEEARRWGRVGMVFAAIKDADGDGGDEPGFRARIEHILYLAQSGEAEKYYSFGAIQTALAVRAWDIWEELWREKYPEQGDQWETGYDFHLMRIWRRRVIRLFVEHHQTEAARLPVKEYVSRLLESGLDGETAGEIAAFFQKAFHQ